MSTSKETPTPVRDDTRALKKVFVGLAVAVTVLAVIFGVVYYLGQRDDAGPSLQERTITTAEAKIRENPNDVGARLSLAAAYTQANRADDALNQYQEIIRVDKNNRAALLGTGVILMNKGDNAGAKKALDKVVAMSGGQEFSGADPQLQEAFYYLGVVNVAMGDIPSAVKNFENSLKIDETDADAWYSLGDAQLRAGAYEKAAAAYNEALRFVPVDWCDPYVGLKGAYTKLNKPDGVTYAVAMNDVCTSKGVKGAAELETLVNGDFKVPAQLGLAYLAEKQMRLDDAVKWYNGVLKTEPQNVAALTGLARLGAAGATNPHAGVNGLPTASPSTSTAPSNTTSSEASQ